LILELDLPDQPLFVNADSARLAQVLDTLLRNAVSYTNAGGRITIAAREDAGDALVTIRDSGIGMEPGEIGALFEPYRQGDGGHRGGGLGLGLTLVKRLVELHGGTVTARSQGAGTGSEFEFSVPLAQTARVDSAAKVSGIPPRYRILVVDDELDVADTFAAILEGLGQDVELAHSGEAALEAARRNAPEVAFLDLSMPLMDGEELAHRLRQEFSTAQLYIVALSGYGMDARKSATEFDDHLLKPVSVETITQLLTSLKTGSPPRPD
jgi:CheY-like chemotaxis protein/anti-sigma regulatory factor (Ser/Thr protein kinase)